MKALAGAGLLLLALLGGCHPGGPAAPAPEEPVLRVYNWADYIGFDTVARFERETGIKVVYDVFDSNEMLEAKLLVGDSGYDIVSTSMAYYGRQIRAGLYEPLDRAELPNWRNLDPQVLAVQSHSDPGNRYAAPYLHSMNGFAYNVPLVRARLPDAPVDSLDMLFKPEVVSHLADCGVGFLDSPEDVLQLALRYLGRDPNSRSAVDLEAAGAVVMRVRPYLRVFDSNDYVNQLATRELCLTMAWSADVSVAVARARTAGIELPVRFVIPREGASITYNALLIPAGAPHPRAAHRFINFILDAHVIAGVTNDIYYGNDNLAARPFVRPEILNDPAIYPPPEVRARLYEPTEFDAQYQRARTRIWTRIKSGL
ncbi:MAG: polyamine ABC transporter substrate-binding protein [Gammaproteobacteria bacterium]|nr:polyamine ABC transporter substrate-binding protein [Gammaproteobacteria bacterium]